MIIVQDHIFAANQIRHIEQLYLKEDNVITDLSGVEIEFTDGSTRVFNDLKIKDFINAKVILE